MHVESRHFRNSFLLWKLPSKLKHFPFWFISDGTWEEFRNPFQNENWNDKCFFVVVVLPHWTETEYVSRKKKMDVSILFSYKVSKLLWYYWLLFLSFHFPTLDIVINNRICVAFRKLNLELNVNERWFNYTFFSLLFFSSQYKTLSLIESPFYERKKAATNTQVSWLMANEKLRLYLKHMSNSLKIYRIQNLSLSFEWNCGYFFSRYFRQLAILVLIDWIIFFFEVVNLFSFPCVPTNE